MSIRRHIVLGLLSGFLILACPAVPAGAGPGDPQRTSEGMGQEGDELTALARFHFDRGELAAAKAAYQRLLERGRREQVNKDILAALRGLADVAVNQRDGPAVRKYGGELATLAQQLARFEPAAVGNLYLGDEAASRNDYETARGHYGKAFHMFIKAVTSGQAKNMLLVPELHFKRGMVERRLGEVENAVDSLQTALSSARKFGDHNTIARSLAELSQIDEVRGDLKAADEKLQEALKSTDTKAAQRHAAFLLSRLIDIAEKRSDPAAVEAWRARLIGVYQRQGNANGEARERLLAAKAAVDKGDLFSAAYHMVEGVRPASSLGEEGIFFEGLIDLARKSRAQGELANAKDILKAILELQQYGRFAVYAHGLLSEVAKDYGDTEGRLLHLEAVTFLAKDPEYHEQLTSAHIQIATLASDLKDWPKAKHHYRQAIALMEARGDKADLWTLHRLMGAIGWQEGDMALVRHHAEKELSLLQIGGQPEELARTADLLSRLALQRGDVAQSEAYIRMRINASSNFADHQLEMLVDLTIAGLARELGKLQLAKQRYARAVTGLRGIGNTETLALALAELALIAEIEADQGTAVRYHKETLAVASKAGEDQLVANAAKRLGSISLERGQVDEADRYLSQARDLYHRLGLKENLARTLTELAWSATLQGESARLTALAGDLMAVATELNDQAKLAVTHETLGLMFSEVREVAVACRHWQKAVSLHHAKGASTEAKVNQERMAAAGCQ